MKSKLILVFFLGLVGWNLLHGFGGFVIGAGFGWLLGMVITLGNRVEEMTRQLTQAGLIKVAQPKTLPVGTVSPDGSTHGAGVASTAPVATAAQASPAPAGRPRPFGPVGPGKPVDAPALAQAQPGLVDRAVPRSAQRAPSAVMMDRWEEGLRAGWQRAKQWMTTGNLPVKIGVVVFLLGVAGAIQYAASAGWLALSMPVRLGAIALAAAAGLVYGIGQAGRRPAFGVAVQGGAIGVLLLVVFGAFARYHLITPGSAFAMVIGIVVTAAVLALRFDARSLAVLGMLGGFVAPVLIGSGQDSPIGLFAYVALLDAGMLVIAWRRPWRALNLLAFVGTFVLGAAWGWRYYTPGYFGQVEPFLVLFFAFFAVIPLLYARAQAGAGRMDRQVDSALLFGAPLAGFAMQAGLLGDNHVGLGLSALVVAIVYASVAMAARRRPALEHLFVGAVAICLGFLAMAIPLALSGRWTSAAWALQGLAMVFVGLGQSRRLLHCAGVWLVGLGSVAGLGYLLDAQWFSLPDQFLLNIHALDVFVLVAAPLAGAWLHHRSGRGVLAGALLALAMAWWGAWGLREIVVNLRGAIEMGGMAGFVPSAYALFAAITAGLCTMASRRAAWPAMAGVQVGASVLILVLGVQALGGGGHWFAAPLWLFWLATGIGLASLAGLGGQESRGQLVAHFCLVILAVAGTALSLARVAGQEGMGGGWQMVAGAIVVAGFAFMLARRPDMALWPLDYQGQAREAMARLAGISLVGLWVVGQFQEGSAAPLPFVPVLNPLEIATIAGLIAAWHYREALGVDERRATDIALALGGWVALSMGVLRAVHHLDGAPWSIWILGNAVAQVGLTMAWCVAGVAAWILGSRRGWWMLWVMGASLLGLVLAKLAVIDRIWLGNAEGVVAFLVVGALLVAVGRFAPSPPRQPARV